MLEWREGASFGGLVEQPARLQLGVLPVGVGKQIFPDHPLPREPPDPDFLPRLFVARRHACHTKVLLVPIGTKEIPFAAKHVIRLVAFEIVAVVPAHITIERCVDGPVTVLAVVTEVAGARKDILQIALRGNPRRHPVVIGLLERGAIVPGGGGSERSFAWRQSCLYAPCGARQQIQRAGDAAHAAIGVSTCGVIHRSGDVRRVAKNAVVGLDATARPRPAHGNVAELHGVVVIDERAPALFFNRRPNLAADLRKNEHAQVFVLEFHHLPLARLRPVGKSIKPEIRIDAPNHRNRVGIAKWIGRKGLPVFAHARRRRRAGHHLGDFRHLRDFGGHWL